jgi:hypothetical protein
MMGVKTEDLDKASAAARTQAKSEFNERMIAAAPHMLTAQREADWEETQYKAANDASTALKLAGLTKQRDNIGVLEGQYDATFNHIDAQTGEERATGAGKLGDMTEVRGPDGKVTNDGYIKGFEATWAGSRGVNDSAVQHLKTAIGSTGTNISSKEGFNSFYNGFTYNGHDAGAKSWVAFYNAVGVPMDEENVNGRDLKGKVFEDVAIRPATNSGIAGWGKSIRDAASQMTSTGVADRSRIPTAGLPEYDVPTTRVNVGPNMQYVTGTAPAFIPGKMTGDVRDALIIVARAYSYCAGGGGRILSTNSNPSGSDYRNAVKTLAHAGYTVS